MSSAGGPAMRVIGVAIAIPDPDGTRLQRYREGYGDPQARSVPTHVTLLPPTTVDDTVLPEIEEHLQTVAQDLRPFELHLRGTGTFRPVSPVVFVQVAEGISACELAERKVRSGPLERPLAFPYHPHITVVHDLADDVLDRAFHELADYEARFPVWGFSLYVHQDHVWRPQRDFIFGRVIAAETDELAADADQTSGLPPGSESAPA